MTEIISHLSSGLLSVFVFDIHLIKLIIVNEILEHRGDGNLKALTKKLDSRF